MTKKSKEEDTSGHPTYLITSNLYSKMRSIRTTLGLQPKESNKILCEEIKGQLKVFLEKAFPLNEIKLIDMDILGDKIFSNAIGQNYDLSNLVIVSTCPEFAQQHNGHKIEINRIYDSSGNNKLGIGPRPGYPILREQINRIAVNTAGNPVVIVEDGTFSGTTLFHIVKKMKEQSIKIKAIIVGIAFPEGINKIREIYDGKIIEIEKVNDFIDWMPDHDFFPFMPNCGRVVGHEWSKHFLPIYNHVGATYSVPYLLPFINKKEMGNWTSLPEKVCFELSEYCLKTMLHFFEELEDDFGECLRIKHIINAKPRVNIPIASNQKIFPSITASVRSYLSDTCHSL